MVSKALYDSQIALEVFNYMPVGRREFIAYTTPSRRAAVEVGKVAGDGVLELPPLDVIEVSFKKPLPGQPVEMTWRPARELITAHIKRWNEESDGEDMSEVSE